ncbi:hypothetical protein BGZ49_009881 [Haplosporangium sp. Z 27]|nr:hypothetical protein BGZ49_009881 [Haplosporangium sp. Z 27]
MMNGNSAPTTTTTTNNVNGRHQTSNNPILVLEPVNDTFALKSLELPEHSKVKIGRQTGVTTAPHPSNGYFDSKVLSRVHAEVWSEGGKVYIRDLKSSNGTFLNGRRLCPENTESEPFELNQNDSLEFGIDIMDENGALLHEKVSCKIYISRMSYPTPTGSPQDSHAKIKSSSPIGSGVNSVKNNVVTAQGGQSENIDLIISRLQNELTRSQETYADLGFLKHGLGELEKVMTFGNKETNITNGNNVPKASTDSNVNYVQLNEQREKEHTAELSKLTEEFEEAKAQWAIQQKQELKALREEKEILRRNQDEANEALTEVASRMDLIMSRVNAMTQEHKQEMEIVQKGFEAEIANLQAKHKDEIDRLVMEADAEQEILSKQHKRELEKAIALAAKENTGENRALEAELSSVKEEVQTLREASKVEFKRVESLEKENRELLQQLDDMKTELKRVQETMKNNLGDLASLKSPTLPETGSSGGEGSTKSAFSWSQFVFPVAKRHDVGLTQPSTMLLSGGFMLVGLGVYAMWHKAGMTAN